MLKCDGITKVYGKKTVLSNFSMEFGAGVYGVLGPNGAGKSTLFRNVAGILLPTAGPVTWNGVEIHKLGGGISHRAGRAAPANAVLFLDERQGIPGIHP